MNNQKAGKWLLDYNDIPLIEYANIFTGNLFWINRGVHNQIATYDLVVRELPANWNFFVFDGLERFLDILQNYKFDDESVALLKAMGLINDKVSEDFYRNFKFSGDIWSLKDGSIFFPGEPIVRVSARISEANLLTAFLLNAFAYPIRLLTKTVRVKIAAKDRMVMTGGSVRLPSLESALFSARSNYLIGSFAMNPLFYKKFGSVDKIGGKVSININHAVIKSFETESDAFAYTLDNISERVALVSLMVDTYDFNKGIANFISEFKKRPQLNQSQFLIALDSGDIEQLAFYSRDLLDKNGLTKIGVMAFSNLDEYKIKELVDKQVPLNLLASITETVNISDAPKIECVYKNAEVILDDGTIEYKAKLTKGKESYPGRKQIFRVYENGKMKRDIIGLENENLGEPLLVQCVKRGEIIQTVPNLDEVKEYLQKELLSLPDEYKEIKNPKQFPVSTSDNLKKIIDLVRKKHV